MKMKWRIYTKKNSRYIFFVFFYWKLPCSLRTYAVRHGKLGRVICCTGWFKWYGLFCTIRQMSYGAMISSSTRKNTNKCIWIWIVFWSLKLLALCLLLCNFWLPCPQELHIKSQNLSKKKWFTKVYFTISSVSRWCWFSIKVILKSDQ